MILAEPGSQEGHNYGGRQGQGLQLVSAVEVYSAKPMFSN